MMTPEQALSILAQATGTIAATRDQHDLILKALDVLKNLIQTTHPKTPTNTPAKD